MASHGPHYPTGCGEDFSLPVEHDMHWSDTTNVYSDNGTEASAGLWFACYSTYLRAGDFDFEIPTGSTINGIVVEIKKRRAGQGAGGISKDHSVVIIKADGTYGTTDRKSADAWPTTAAYTTYGSSTDLWGETWTAEDINDAYFGVALALDISYLGYKSSEYGYIDAIRITIYYTEGASSPAPSISDSAPVTESVSVVPYTSAISLTYDTANSTSGADATSLTLSYTMGAGSNGILVAALDVNGSGRTVSSFTYNGSGLSLAVSNIINYGTAIYYIVNPPSGAHDLVLTMSGSCGWLALGAVSYFGADQSSPIDDTDSTAMVSTLTPSLTLTTVVGQVVVGTLLAEDYGTHMVDNANQSNRWNIYSAGASLSSFGSTKDASTTSTNIGWTKTGSTFATWCSAAAIKEAAVANLAPSVSDETSVTESVEMFKSQLPVSHVIGEHPTFEDYTIYFGGLQQVDDAASGTVVGTNLGMWRRNSFSSAQWAATEIGSIWSDAGVALRIQSDGSCYIFTLSWTTNEAKISYVNSSGVVTTLATDTSWFIEEASGETLLAEIEGNALRMYYMGTLIISITDNTIASGGFPGIYSSVADEGGLLCFYAGNYAPAIHLVTESVTASESITQQLNKLQISISDTTTLTDIPNPIITVLINEWDQVAINAVIDRFNRADESPIAAPWTTIGGAYGQKIADGFIRNRTNLLGGLSWRSEVLGGSHFIEWTVRGANPAYTGGVVGCSTTLGTGYHLWDAGSGYWILSSVILSTGATTSISTYSGSALADGARVRVELITLSTGLFNILLYTGGILRKTFTNVGTTRSDFSAGMFTYYKDTKGLDDFVMGGLDMDVVTVYPNPILISLNEPSSIQEFLAVNYYAISNSDATSVTENISVFIPFLGAVSSETIGVATGYTDAFTRANQNPISSPWINPRSGYELQLYSNAVCGKANSNFVAYYGSAILPNSHYVQWTSGGPDCKGGAFIAFSPALTLGYFVRYDTTWKFASYDTSTGTVSQIGSTFADTVIAGQTLRVEVVNNEGMCDVKLYNNGTLKTTWLSAFATRTDWYAGLYSNGDTSYLLDNFETGSLDLSPISDTITSVVISTLKCSVSEDVGLSEFTATNSQNIYSSVDTLVITENVSLVFPPQVSVSDTTAITESVSATITTVKTDILFDSTSVTESVSATITAVLASVSYTTSVTESVSALVAGANSISVSDSTSVTESPTPIISALKISTTTGASARTDYWTCPVVTYMNTTDTTWIGETFTATSNYTATSVKLPLDRAGCSMGTLYVSIRTMSGSHPSSTILCSGSIAIPTLPSGSFSPLTEISLGAGTSLASGTKYAIVGYTSQYVGVHWCAGTTPNNTYTNGSLEISEYVGPSWSTYSNWDLGFEIWGSTSSAIGDDTSVTESTSAIITKVQTAVNDSTAATESASATITNVVALVSDTSTVTEDVQEFLTTLVPSISDTTEVTESVAAAVVGAHKPSISDTTSVTESASATITNVLSSISDTTEVTESLSESITVIALTVDTTEITESASATITNVVALVSDTSTVTEDVQEFLTKLVPVINDSTSVTESVSTAMVGSNLMSVSDTTSVTESITDVRVVGANTTSVNNTTSITESLGLVVTALKLAIFDDQPVIEVIISLLPKLPILVNDETSLTERCEPDISDDNIRLSEESTITEELSLAISSVKCVINDTTGISETLTLFMSIYVPVVSDLTSLTESLSLSISAVLTSMSDLISVTESVSLLVSNILASASDSTAITESVSGAITTVKITDLFDSTSVIENVSATITKVLSSVSDTTSVTEDAQEFLIKLVPTINDSTSVTESVNATVTAVLSSVVDTTSVTEDASIFLTKLVPSISDNIPVIEDIQEFLTKLVPSISDSTPITEGISIFLAKLVPSISEDTSVTEDVNGIVTTVLGSVNEVIVVTESLQVIITVVLISVSETTTVTEDVPIFLTTLVPSIFDTTSTIEYVLPIITAVRIEIFDNQSVIEDIVNLLPKLPIFVSDEITLIERCEPDISDDKIRLSEESTITEELSLIISQVKGGVQDSVIIDEFVDSIITELKIAVSDLSEVIEVTIQTVPIILITVYDGGIVCDLFSTPLVDVNGIPLVDVNGIPLIAIALGTPLLDSNGMPLLDSNGIPIVAMGTYLLDSNGIPILDSNGVPLVVMEQLFDINGVPLFDVNGVPLVVLKTFIPWVREYSNVIMVNTVHSYENITISEVVHFYMAKWKNIPFGSRIVNQKSIDAKSVRSNRTVNSGTIESSSIVRAKTITSNKTVDAKVIDTVPKTIHNVLPN
jgi:hypothetical protein